MSEEKDKGLQKLADPVVVEPRKTLLDPRVYDPVILCPVGPLTTLMARAYKASKKFMSFEPTRVYTITHKGRKASLVGPCMGAPAATYVLERLIANKVKHVIMLGLCGSISREVKIGHLVVPIGARVEEGVSRHYYSGPRKAYPGERALEAIQKAVEESGKSYHKGPVWTTDAVFRETQEKVKSFGNKGLLAVEMEASALFTVAAYRGIELGALLVASDELFDLRWRVGFTRPRFLSACRHASRIALNAAFKLSGKDDPDYVEDDDLEEESETSKQEDEEPEKE